MRRMRHWFQVLVVVLFLMLSASAMTCAVGNPAIVGWIRQRWREATDYTPYDAVDWKNTLRTGSRPLPPPESP